MLERFGFSFDLQCKKKGFFPKGGGEVVASTNQDNPITLRCVDLMERGKIESIGGIAWSAGEHDATYAAAMAKEAKRVLRRALQDVPIDVEAKFESRQSAIGSGRGIVLWANTSTGCILGADALGGKKGTTAEELGEEAAKSLIKNIQAGGCVDEHLQDQLIIFAVLAKGTSHIRCGPLTLHTETAIVMSEQMTDAKISKKSLQDGTVILTIVGIGHSAT
uniref:RNA 3'-terminal phosphate cyclase n=1 Tax=Plectus sambesii TaxID=2011161 RepID=A0A914V9X2_9BILA